MIQSTTTITGYFLKSIFCFEIFMPIYSSRHRGEHSFVDVYGYDKEVWGDLGAGHADELYLMFTNPLNHKGRTPEDQKVSDMIIRMWTSFAKGNAPDEKWEPFNGNESFHVIDSDAEIRTARKKEANGELVSNLGFF